MIEPVDLDEVGRAIGLGPHELVSLVGGGGKTTLLFALGQQLGGSVVLTTTTKMARERTDGLRVMVGPSDGDLSGALASAGPVVVWSGVDGHKARGVAPAACDRWFALADHVVVEADGSRQRPLTAPSPFEPVVPSATTVLIACAGAGAFGRVIADRCHRPMRIAALAGCSPYERLTPSRLATVLLSPRGLQKDRPLGSRFVIAVHAVTPADRPFLDELAEVVGDRAPVVAVTPAAAGRG